MTSLFEGIAGALLSILFPERCAACGKAGRSVCPLCKSKIHVHTPVEIRACRGADAVFVCGHYDGVLKKLIRSLKFGRKRLVARHIGEFMADVLSGIEALRRFDAIVPIPVHRSRLAERGFNQSELIAGPIAERYGIPVLTVLMERTRNTRFMYNLGADQRRANVKGAFRASEKAKGKRIILVDDVYTTGSTMSEAAVSLKRRGAVEVAGIAAACAETSIHPTKRGKK